MSDREQTAFAAIAFVQAEAGHGADALRWADELNNPVIRSRALMGLAQGLPAAGKPCPWALPSTVTYDN